ncbi:MAG: DUF885 domain-containing protein [Gemmataceae bacterium]
MSRRHVFVLVVLGYLFAVNATIAAPAKETKSGFADFVDEYFDAYFAWNPSTGTSVGLHQYDRKLENNSAKAVAKRIQEVKGLQQRLEKLRKGKLPSSETIDAEILAGQMQSELLDLETVRNWTKNPINYIMTPAGSVDGLMKRNFAPASERLRAVVARLKATPAMYEAMRANTENPPREFTDLAIRVGQGSIGFYRDTVGAWAKEAAGKDANLLKEFDDANAEVVKSLDEAVAWMKKDLLPRSKGSYALGRENFAKQLLYEEMVDIPLDKLLAIGEANLKRDQKAFAATAKKIDPTKTPAEVMKALSDDHPTADDLIPSTKRTIEKCRQFLIDKHIVTVPSEVRPTVLETPPYARNGGFASMDTPGPFETMATEAFYYVTPPEKDWDAKHVEEHLRLFNKPVTQIITIHEAFPGHYIQFLYAKQYPTKTRKITGCGTNVEGWAHYTEQMMVEEGYGQGDLKIQLAQLSEALLRDCRYVVGIKLHTEGMTVEEGAKFFEREGHQEPATAYEEARRGAYNPTYLYYTLGKLQIYKFREDYRKAKGKDFNLETFHNEFVKQGGIPIKLIRRIMLPEDKGPAL